MASKNWGGPRMGAGRPRKRQNRVQVTVYLSPTEASTVKRHCPDLSLGKAVKWIVKQWHSSKTMEAD